MASRAFNQGQLWATKNDLVVDGFFGTASVKKLQGVLGTLTDGIISGQPTANKQYFPNLFSFSFGTGGSTAVKALQSKLGVSVDGLFGPQTIKAWQKKLGVTADGYFGPASVKAVQKALNNNKLW
mgnify:FL=1